MAKAAPQQAEEKAAKTGSKVRAGLTLERYFTRAGVNPYDEIEWEARAATILNEKGKVVFEQTNVEIPKAWSLMATQVVVSKYFRGPLGSPKRETSVRQLIDRIFVHQEDRAIDELIALDFVPHTFGPMPPGREGLREGMKRAGAGVSDPEFVIHDLIAEVGFEPVDSGPLASSRTSQM